MGEYALIVGLHLEVVGALRLGGYLAAVMALLEDVGVEDLVDIEDALCQRVVELGDDAIAEALGSDEKKEAAQTGGRRRRRGGAQSQAAEEKADAAKSGIVTDPLIDAPMVVTMTITVHDFRSLEDGDKNQGNEKGEEAK